MNLPNATVDLFSMGKDVNFPDYNNMNCTEYIEEKFTSVGIFSQSKIGTFFFLCVQDDIKIKKSKKKTINKQRYNISLNKTRSLFFRLL